MQPARPASPGFTEAWQANVQDLTAEPFPQFRHRLESALAAPFDREALKSALSDAAARRNALYLERQQKAHDSDRRAAQALELRAIEGLVQSLVDRLQRPS